MEFFEFIRFESRPWAKEILVCKCFGLLALNNLAVVLDLLILPERDFRLTRLFLSLGAVGVLLFGFIWDREE